MTGPDTVLGALMVGMVTSLHCAGMCGPLACGLGTLAKSEGQRLAAASLYHGSRLFSYAAIGAVCGMLGQQPLKWFFKSPAVVLPWVLVVILLLMATGLDQRLPRPAFLNRFIARTRFQTGRFSAYGAATTMGLLTPLLPCTPLYLVFFSALHASSAAKGAEYMLAFGLGTVPLLWLAQHGFHRVRAKLTPLAMNRLRRGLALVTALVLALRLHGTLPAPVPDSGSRAIPVEEEELPSCCH